MEDYILKTNPDGSKTTVRDVQMVLLQMLKDIDEVCRKHDIPYYLSGGSCLGAVRHKGFIPWDDDADICMMYDDYQRFLCAVKDLPNSYYVQSFDTHKEYNVLIPAMKVRLKDTYVEEYNFLLKNRCKDGDGLFIDVFIADYVSEKRWKDALWRILQLVLLPFIVLFENLHLNPLPLKKLFVWNARHYGRINKEKGSKLIGYDLCWCFDLIRSPVVYPYRDVYPVAYVPFEDTQLPIPNSPKSLLDAEVSINHMSYPPKEDQKPKHIKDIRL